MTTGRSTTALVAAVLAAAIAGCSTSTGAERTPGPFPPRPVNVAVDDLDPCSTLDATQQGIFDLREGSQETITVNEAPSAICTWRGPDDLGYNVQTIRASADLALSEPGAAPVVVNGFGAARSIWREFTGAAPICQLTIDAAPGRAIRVQVGATPAPPQPTEEETCRLATDAAAAVMTTVTSAPG